MRNNRKKTQCKLSAKSENNCLFFPSFFLLHFAFTCVVFLCTVPARGRARCVYIPSKQACFCTYTAQPKATRFQTLLTHVYCHHQEVAPLNSSTELNFSLLLKTSPWEWGKKKTTTRFQHPRTVPFSFSEARIISESAQKQRQNRTQVVVSTQRVIFPQRCDCLCFLFVLFLFKLVSWDWHILYSEK